MTKIPNFHVKLKDFFTNVTNVGRLFSIKKMWLAPFCQFPFNWLSDTSENASSEPIIVAKVGTSYLLYLV